MIFFKKKIIFIHIPRCGGTSIEQNLWKNEFNKNFTFKESDENHLLQGFIDQYRNKYQYDGLQHLTLSNINKIYPKETKNFFKFTFIRNPFSRIASAYAGIMTFRKDLRNFLVLYKDTSFKKFLELIQKNSHTHWMPMSNFFKDEEINFVGRFENYNEDLNRLEKIVQINLIKENFSGELNFSEKFNYLDFYKDKNNIDTVYKLFKEDFNRFNYDYYDFEKYEKKKISSISMSSKINIPKKERTLWRFLKKYIKKKIYLLNNSLKY
jgi:hypothetical protein